MNKKGGIGKFVAGMAVGAGLGLLFAPKSGAETRKELKKKIDELIKKLKNIDVKEIRDSFVKKIDDIKADLADLDKEKVLEIAKKKAEDIKTKLDNLMTEAKEKATPVVQKTVDDLRKKTIVVLKDTIKKLEGTDKGNSKKALKAE